MKRPLKPEELRLWGMVAATVHPLTGRAAPKPARPQSLDAAARIDPTTASARAAQKLRDAVEGIEPNRRHRIAKEREEIGGRIDLHGLTQERARAALEAFLARAYGEGWRAVLVITGKGVQGDGVLKKRAPDWLGAPHLSHIVAGISEAHRRHGGEGALYVALKRKPRG
jgi:DNA-nicking Smr family endonuclease